MMADHSKTYNFLGFPRGSLISASPVLLRGNKLTLGRDKKAAETEDVAFVSPKELADVRGVSYSSSLLWRFGMITVSQIIYRLLNVQT